MRLWHLIALQPIRLRLDLVESPLNISDFPARCKPAPLIRAASAHFLATSKKRADSYGEYRFALLP